MLPEDQAGQCGINQVYDHDAEMQRQSKRSCSGAGMGF